MSWTIALGWLAIVALAGLVAGAIWDSFGGGR